MNSKIKDDSVDFLFRAVLSLKTVEECYNFFEDLCTVPEIKAMSQRLLVAHMLSKVRVQRYCGAYRRVHRDDQPRQPLAQLRLRRLCDGVLASGRRGCRR